MTLVRNERWDAESDPLRPAYPDRIEVELGLDQADIDQRLRADDDADHAAIAASALDPVTAAEVAGAQALAERTIRGSGLGVRFIAVNTERLPVLQHRRAILTALDRSAVHDAAGGDLTGRLADGLIPPYVSADATTEQPWTDLLGRTIPPDGDPGHARELIADLGRPMPALQLAHGDTTADRAVAEAIARSLRVAGIDVEPVPLPPGEYQPAIRHPHSPYELMLGSWFPAWMDASTVITELLTPDGGAANLSRYDVPGFTADAAQAAAELDGAERASMWAALDARAVADAAVIPLRFDRQLRLVGSQVRGARVWAPYGSTAYAALWVAR